MGKPKKNKEPQRLRMVLPGIPSDAKTLEQLQIEIAGLLNERLDSLKREHFISSKPEQFRIDRAAMEIRLLRVEIESLRFKPNE